MSASATQGGHNQSVSRPNVCIKYTWNKRVSYWTPTSEVGLYNKVQNVLRTAARSELRKVLF